MAELTLDEARVLLREHGGYDWLLEGPQFWSVKQVVGELEKVGMQVSHDSVGRWFKDLPHTQDFGGPVGLRASRNDLIQHFARQMLGAQQDRGRRTG